MRKRTVSRIIMAIPLCMATVVVLYPLLLLCINSIKTPSQFLLSPLSLPSGIHVENFQISWQKARLDLAIPNTVWLLVMSEVLLVGTGALAAYPIARIKSIINTIALQVFFAGMIIPAQVIAIPLFVQMRTLKLVNSLAGLALVLTATLLPLTIFIYSGFFKTIPREIEEAASIDGCNRIGIFLRMILPLSGTATATIVLLTSLHIWREFFYPLVLASKLSVRTLSVALFSFQSFDNVQWTQLFAAMVIMMAPVIILFIGGQRFIIRGAVAGSVKA